MLKNSMMTLCAMLLSACVSSDPTIENDQPIVDAAMDSVVEMEPPFIALVLWCEGDELVTNHFDKDGGFLGKDRAKCENGCSDGACF